MTDRLTPAREAEMQQRVDAATPGPWGSHRDLNAVYTVQARPRTTRNGMENDGDIATLATDRSDAESYANARFIAHAREDVRVLLAELSAVRAERNTAQSLVDELACPTCKGSGLDPDDEGDWDSAVGRHNPNTIGPCPTCMGDRTRQPAVRTCPPDCPCQAVCIGPIAGAQQGGVTA
ncbi:hypothetical protein ACPCTG_31655 [Streptomyces pseudogriseolus]|uniref:hypothetical protein n=1 Tax=Streptomyces pseudogriseolus TaxID=36817 RepID=UPI003FA1ADAE